MFVDHFTNETFSEPFFSAAAQDIARAQAAERDAILRRSAVTQLSRLCNDIADAMLTAIFRLPVSNATDDAADAVDWLTQCDGENDAGINAVFADASKTIFALSDDTVSAAMEHWRATETLRRRVRDGETDTEDGLRSGFNVLAECHTTLRVPASPDAAEAYSRAEQLSPTAKSAHTRAVHAVAPGSALWVDAGAWCESSIPPRPWYAPSYLMRGSVTAIGGAGGVSKSTLANMFSGSAALGIPFGTFRPVAPGRVLLFNVEDDAMEQRRRLSAMLRHFNKTPADVAGKIIRAGPRGVGTLLERDARTGAVTATRAMEQLAALIEEHRPDLVVLDPLVELHTTEENDNTGLRAIMAHLRGIAQASNAALLLVHHTRKGLGSSAGEADSLRGASSIVGAARVVLTVTGMQPEEAKRLGMPPNQSKHYFRLDGAKSNYAPLTEAEWFERVAYELDNGDHVAVPVPWQPPEDAAPAEAVEAILSGIAAGSPGGAPWSPRLSSDLRSVRSLFAQHGITTSNGQSRMLAELQSKHGCAVAAFKDPIRRKLAQGLRTSDGQPAEAAWEA